MPRRAARDEAVEPRGHVAVGIGRFAHRLQHQRLVLREELPPRLRLGFAPEKIGQTDRRAQSDDRPVVVARVLSLDHLVVVGNRRAHQPVRLRVGVVADAVHRADDRREILLAELPVLKLDDGVADARQGLSVSAEYFLSV